MRFRELLTEKPVQSAWISDITYNRPNHVITMRLSNGRSFSVSGISRSIFEQWVKSQSKGRFFHQRIKNNYQVNRIK